MYSCQSHLEYTQFIPIQGYWPGLLNDNIILAWIRWIYRFIQVFHNYMKTTRIKNPKRNYGCGNLEGNRDLMINR